MPLDFVSNTDEKVPVLVNPVRSNGKPATIDGRPVLSIVSGNATVENATQQQADAYEAAHGVEGKGLAGFVISEDADGSSEWKVTADADLGTGVTEISEGGVYTYSAAPAVSVGAKAGNVEPK